MQTDIKEISINGVVYVEKSAVESANIVDTSGMTWCVIRSRDQGVMFGLVDKPLEIESRCVTVHRARQIWSWNSAFVLVELAEKGPAVSAEMRMSCESTNPVRMLEACGILICSSVGAEKLRTVPATVKK